MCDDLHYIWREHASHSIHSTRTTPNTLARIRKKPPTTPAESNDLFVEENKQLKQSTQDRSDERMGNRWMILKRSRTETPSLNTRSFFIGRRLVDFLPARNGVKALCNANISVILSPSRPTQHRLAPPGSRPCDATHELSTFLYFRSVPLSSRLTLLRQGRRQ